MHPIGWCKLLRRILKYKLFLIWQAKLFFLLYGCGSCLHMGRSVQVMFGREGFLKSPDRSGKFTFFLLVKPPSNRLMLLLVWGMTSELHHQLGINKTENNFHVMSLWFVIKGGGTFTRKTLWFCSITAHLFTGTYYIQVRNSIGSCRFLTQSQLGGWWKIVWTKALKEIHPTPTCIIPRKVWINNPIQLLVYNNQYQIQQRSRTVDQYVLLPDFKYIQNSISIKLRVGNCC